MNEPVWAAVSQQRLRWREWDGEFVVFDDWSGDTHLLQPIAAAILRELAEGPCSVAELRRAVVSLAGETAGIESGVEEILWTLQRQGLVTNLDRA